MSTGWRSWHLHIATFAPAALDAVVTEALGPLADRLGLLEPAGPPWFFVRYWQGGPHLRLRVRGLTDAGSERLEAVLADRLRLLDAAVPSAQRLDQDGYARAVHRIAAAGEQPGIPQPVGELLAPGLRRAAYQPEYERYGGRRLIAASEHLFHHSSRLALRACLARAGTPHALASGLEASAAACAVLTAEQRSAFLTAQRDHWLHWAPPVQGAPADSSAAALGPLAPRLREAMHTGDPRWAPWTDPLAAAFRTWTTEFGFAPAARIFGAHLHMTANRLGVDPAREARIAALLLALRPAEGRDGADRGRPDAGLEPA